ncbi:MAG: DUF6531 domain-containing protein [Bdellovibrio sp.]|jgi:hypothetical protein
MTHKALLLLSMNVLLLTHEKALSDVNLQEGSFTLKRHDNLVYSPTSTLKLERTYSSRSNHQGILGLAWCSTLEWKFYAKAKLLEKCDNFEVLAASSIKMNGDRSLVLASKSETLVFDASTRLVAIEQNKNKFTVMRDLTGRATGLLNSKGILWALIYGDPLQTMTRVSMNVGGEVRGSLSFSYEGTQLAKTKQESYVYDAAANLTQVKNNFQQKEIQTKIQYDELKDQVIAVFEGTCQTTYKYHTQDSRTKVRDLVHRVTMCPGQKRNVASTEVTTEFTYEKTSNNEIRLEKISENKHTLPTSLDRLSALSPTE